MNYGTETVIVKIYPDWIPVSDRLPEETFVNYIVALYGRQVLQMSYVGDGNFVLPTHSIFATEDNPVTHWPPLPQPPQS